jgi:hypothetical protein
MAKSRRPHRRSRWASIAAIAAFTATIAIPPAYAETSSDYHSERYEIADWCTSAYTVGAASAKPLASFAANWRMTYGNQGTNWMTRIVTGDNQDPRFSIPYDWATGEAGNKCGTDEKAFAQRIKVFAVYVIAYDTTSCRLSPSLSLKPSGVGIGVSGSCSGGHGFREWRFSNLCEPADGKVNACTVRVGKAVFSAPDGVRITGLGRKADVLLWASKQASSYPYGTALCSAGGSDSGLRCS